MLVTDRHRSRLPLVEAVAQAVMAGIDAVQLREKDLDDAALHELAVRLRQITAGRCLLIINSRADIALAVGADGVQLPERGLPLAAARQIAPGLLIGQSVHSAGAARAAAIAGADYIQLGTIFATASKPGKAPDGLSLVHEATEGLSIPCLGVGGIDSTNAASVIEAGAQGVAVVSAILQARDVAFAVRALRSAVTAPQAHP